jgi:hypothetical protein
MREAAARQIDRDKSVSSFMDLNVVKSLMIKLFLSGLRTINTIQIQ